MSRADYVAKNVKFAVVSQAALVLINFVVRKVFVMTLGEEYLGLSGLFSDILSMLSLAELGFGTSVTFSLYKPLATGDTEKIKSLMRVFKRAYQFVGAFILIAGMVLTPFLRVFLKEIPQDIPYTDIQWIYILNVINSGGSYFFIYKATLLFADQKKYVEMIITIFAKVIAGILQIAVLLMTKNYFLYLTVMICATFLQNFLVSLQTDRIYPFLKEKEVKALGEEDKKTLKKNVSANVFHKVGYVAVYSTDSLLMAKFAGVAAVGLYSNYMLIRKALLNVIDLLFVSLAASMGNLNASESDERKREVYGYVFFFSAWMFGFICICLWCLFNPFISLWLGKEYLLSDLIVLLITANFYMYCMRMPVNNTKEAMGLFWNDRYKPIAEVAVNLVVSILLGRYLGIVGVLLGTLISTVTVPFLVEPYVVYRHGLKMKAYLYYLQYFKYTGITLLNCALTWWLCGFTTSGIVGFLCKMLICAVVPNLVYLIIYGRTKEFRYIKETVLRIVRGRWRGV